MAYCKHVRANSPFLVAFRSPDGLEAASFPEQPLSTTPALAVEKLKSGRIYNLPHTSPQKIDNRPLSSE
jgi:hypothetical protein